MSYQTEWTIRFGDVDAAGIIYYPQLFDRVVRGVEELLEDIGWPVSGLVAGDMGMPIVSVEADLTAPIRLEDTLDIEITPTIGESSVEYAVTFSRDGEQVALASQTMVAIDLETFETRPLPADLRTSLDAV